MHTDSVNGNKYLILFTDDFSRYTWIHFMNMKSEAFKMFIKFKALAKNEADLKIKTLRLNNALSFYEISFKSSCKRRESFINSRLHTILSKMECVKERTDQC